MNLVNQKGFKLMQQLKPLPKLIIPHHGKNNLQVVEEMKKRWSKVFLQADARVTIEKERLRSDTQVLIIGAVASMMLADLNLPTW